ncbi:MAG TPA: FhaA domain-containing protein [Anaerolineales bacterium]|nr:FhaA domain-containing protein [Anaerolineales bacterium]
MNLQELEARLQSLIEVHLVSVLPGQKPESLIVQKLTTAMQASAIQESNGKGVAPNVYTLLAHPSTLERWKEPHLLETLLDVLKTAGKEANLKFSTPPAISIAEDPSLTPGDFNIIASHRVEPMAETQDMKNDLEGEGGENEPIPDNAFLIVEGVKVFPLKQGVVNIGRRLDNTLVIDDPRVSRNHAQLRAIKGRYVLFDLNSTGGTFVNGQRASQSVLYAGDVISLAGVALIFGQDNPPPRPDLAETSPLNEAGADRKTAIIQTLPPTKKKKK